MGVEETHAKAVQVVKKIVSRVAADRDSVISKSVVNGGNNTTTENPEGRHDSQDSNDSEKKSGKALKSCTTSRSEPHEHRRKDQG